MAEIINRLANETATEKDCRTLAKSLPSMSRRQLKDLAIMITGREVYGLKDEIIEQVRELLIDE